MCEREMGGRKGGREGEERRERDRERLRGSAKDKERYSTLLYSTPLHFPFLTSEKDRSPARFEVKIISPSTTLERTLDPPDSRVTVSVPEKHDLSKKDVDRFFEDWRGIMLGYRVGYCVKFVVYVTLEGREVGVIVGR
jgi:hypothetical protein